MLVLQPVFSAAVIAECREVPARARFRFGAERIASLLDTIELLELRLEPLPIDLAELPDAKDSPLIALAQHALCPVITGNARHFPKRLGVVVMTPREWVELAAGAASVERQEVKPDGQV